ncbi:MAG: carbohydrate kinase family protein [SAR324 cluster bacterium]|nr:carbohydrate kinase family protein [SAR324 cluster bacterium]
MDIRVRDVHQSGRQQVEAWDRGSVHFLKHPLEPSLGGTAATAYLLGCLGENVLLNTLVGNDTFGALLKTWFDDAGVCLLGPFVESTATNVLLAEPDGTPHWHYFTGKNVEWERSLSISDASWFYTSGFGQASETDLKEMNNLFVKFSSQGSKVAFDPGPWLFANVSQEQMQDSWRSVDCLVGTESELSLWYGCDSVTELIQHLLQLGPSQVVVKRGSEGAAFGEIGAEVQMLPTERIDNANAVGAGDAFNAALLHSLNQGVSLFDSVKTAIQLATNTLRRGKGILGAELIEKGHFREA